MTSKSKKLKMNEYEKLQMQVASFLKYETQALEKRNLRREVVVAFPSKKKVPFLGWVAVKLLSWSGAVFDFNFFNK